MKGNCEMSRKKMRDFMAVVFVGLFFLTQQFIFIWFLIGSIVLLHPENGEKEDEWNTAKSLRMARRDAKKYGLRIPDDASIRQMTGEVYQRFHPDKRAV